MKHCLFFAAILFLMARCENELAFEDQSFSKKTTLPCKGSCPHITLKIAGTVVLVQSQYGDSSVILLRKEKEPLFDAELDELLLCIDAFFMCSKPPVAHALAVDKVLAVKSEVFSRIHALPRPFPIIQKS